MRVLHVTDSFLPKIGGAEQAIDHLVRGLTAAGCPSSVLAQINRGVGTEVDVPYDVRRFGRPRGSLWAGWWIGRHIARLERQTGPFDALIGHHAFPPGFAVTAYAKKHRRKAIVHVRGGDIYLGSRFRGKRLAWAKLTRGLTEADAVVALSWAMRDLVLEIAPQARVKVIPNGIDLGAYAQDASGSKFASDPRLAGPFVLGLGRAVKRKGFDLLIDAFALADPAGWRLVIAGDGRDLAALKHLAAPLGDRVIFTGMVGGADKRWLLQHCRFSAAPSREESFPNVVLEAFACGKPVLGSDAGGFADLISPINFASPPQSPSSPDQPRQILPVLVDERAATVGMRTPDTEGSSGTGLITPVGDIAALAAALKRLTATDLSAASLAALSTAKRFAWPEVSRRYAELIRSL